MQAHGFGYGPAFQGLREAWRVGDAVYGRAVLPEALSESAEAYGVHPALSIRRCTCWGSRTPGSPASATVRCCCCSSGRRFAPRPGAGAARARVGATSWRGELARCRSWPMGTGLAGAGGRLRLREASAAQIREAGGSEAQHLYRLEWRPLALSEAWAASEPRLIVGGDGELARSLGLDRVDSVAALVARLDAGGTRPWRCGVRSCGGAGPE